MEEKDEQLEYYDRMLWEWILTKRKEKEYLRIAQDLAVKEAQEIINAKD